MVLHHTFNVKILNTHDTNIVISGYVMSNFVNERSFSVVYFVLKLTERISKFLGASTIYVLQKIFGIILLAISVKLFVTNLAILIERN